MTANAERGEIDITLDGQSYVLRPSHEALVACEKQTGLSLVEMARAAEAGTLTLTQCAQIVVECVRAQGKVIGDDMMQKFSVSRVAALLFEAEGGVLLANMKLRILLVLACSGGVTASGEIKPTMAKAASAGVGSPE